MNAERLLDLFDTAATIAPSVRPLVQGGLVKNADQVTLHRGSTPVSFKGDPKIAYPDFQKPRSAGDFIDPEDIGGISVSVLDSDEDCKLEVAHDRLLAACRHRLLNRLKVIREEVNTEVAASVATAEVDEVDTEELSSVPPKLWKSINTMKSSYHDLIGVLASCSVPRFRDEEIPYCYIRIVNPFYHGAELHADKTKENPHHCLVKVRSRTPLQTVDRMATCAEPGWSPCPYLLRAAAKPNLVIPNLDRESASSLTLTVWDALDHLLDNFSDGGDWIGVQEAFEICSYQVRIAGGDLVFKERLNSGLENVPRLAALVELALDFDYWVQDTQARIFIEHDLAVALKDATPGV